jgi:hypothetical protein
MDRVLMHRGHPQIYGTQYLLKDGVLTLWTVREPAGPGERRRAWPQTRGTEPGAPAGSRRHEDDQGAESH